MAREKRKHLLLVEITLDHADTERRAMAELRDLLQRGRVHRDGGGSWHMHQSGDPSVKSFERATRARAQSGDALAATRATALAAGRAAERLRVIVEKLEAGL